MNEKSFERNLSMPEAWAFSIGTSIGWGSLVITCSNYLAEAGPVGSTVGLILGGIVMFVMALNYAHLINICPDAGGAYSFAKKAFGYDFGFLTSWFLVMTYLAIFWANATSLPLFARIFLGDHFKYLKLYTIFGYDVYLGEVLLSSVAILITGLLCMFFGKLTHILVLVMSSFFTVAIATCFLTAFLQAPYSEPLILKDSSAISQIVRIALISPWAFIGFESISHTAEEYSFSEKKIRSVLLVSVAATLALYIMITLLSVTAFPQQYDSWLAYIQDLNNLSGIEALPAFYAANYYMGNAGIILLSFTLLFLVLTSFFGNITALSRLFYAMAKDGILPEEFGKLNKQKLPGNAVLLVIMISIIIPSAGRTAIGWIVDVTTILGTLVYGIVAACAIKLAKENGEKEHLILGWTGLISMVLFFAGILLPNFFTECTLAKESFFFFIAWCVVGFLYFKSILHRDRQKRFGSSSVVWVALLSLVLVIAFVWMRQALLDANEKAISEASQYFISMQNDTLAGYDTSTSDSAVYYDTLLNLHNGRTTQIIFTVMGMFVFALLIMLSNHAYLNKRTRESELRANTDPMTGVKSKHAFMLREADIDAAIRKNKMSDFSVVICDVNGLKAINDTYGHKAGDEYICSACRMICRIFSHSPVFRLGGDEFLVILSDSDYIIRLELLQALHDQSVENIKDGGVVVSGGLSDYIAGEDEDFHTVFIRADALMYEEKKLLKSMGAVTRD